MNLKVFYSCEEVKGGDRRPSDLLKLKLEDECTIITLVTHEDIIVDEDIVTHEDIVAEDIIAIEGIVAGEDMHIIAAPTL